MRHAGGRRAGKWRGIRGGLAPALAVLLSAPVAAGTITLEAVRDNTLFEDADGDTSNGTGPALFAGRNSQGRARRALIRFDVRSAVPPGAAIDSATLHLWLSSSSDPAPRVARLHRVLADWGEGGSSSSGGAGALAQPGDATWLHTFHPAASWSTPGGDYEPQASAEATVAGTGAYAWRDVRLTRDVQSWLHDGAEHGWILVGDEDEPGTARRFDAREHATPERRPRLTLHYSMATRGSPHTWASLKRRYR